MTGSILDGLVRITEDTIKMASEIKNAKDSKTKDDLVHAVLDGLTNIGLDTAKIAKDIKHKKKEPSHHEKKHHESVTHDHSNPAKHHETVLNKKPVAVPEAKVHKDHSKGSEKQRVEHLKHELQDVSSSFKSYEECVRKHHKPKDCQYKHIDALEEAHFSGVRVLHPYSDVQGNFALDELDLEPHKHLVLQVESLFASGHGEKL